MARKEIMTSEKIVATAFEMIREEGLIEVTARKLANRLGCSTQPIFRLYTGMAELIEILYEEAIAYFQGFYKQCDKISSTPFIDLGQAYIRFADEEKHLFQLLFLSEQRGERSMYDIVNGENAILNREINSVRRMRCKDPSGLFMKMWIFIHGIACMTITGDYDLSEQETVLLLEETFDSYLEV